MFIIMGVIALIVSLNIGIVLGGWLSSRSYAGVIVVHKTEDKILYSLEIDSDLDELQYKKDIRLHVITEEEALDRE